MVFGHCAYMFVRVCVHAIYNLELAAYLVILHALLSSAFFFKYKIKFIEKFLHEYHQIAKQFGSGSG